MCSVAVSRDRDADKNLRNTLTERFKSKTKAINRRNTHLTEYDICVTKRLPLYRSRQTILRSQTVFMMVKYQLILKLCIVYTDSIVMLEIETNRTKR